MGQVCAAEVNTDRQISEDKIRIGRASRFNPGT